MKKRIHSKTLPVVFSLFACGFAAMAAVTNPTPDPASVVFDETVQATYVDNISITATPVLLQQNCRLGRIQSVTGDLFLFHTDYNAYPFLFENLVDQTGAATPGAGVYHLQKNLTGDDQYVRCEFIGRWNNGYTMVMDLKLTQVGNDIYAEVTKTHYPYNNAYSYVATHPYYDTAATGGVYGTIIYATTNWNSISGMVRMSLHNVELQLYSEQFTVTFLDKDGGVVSSGQVYRGDAAVPPTMPQISGYEFLGWDADTSLVESNITARAQYVQKISVTFKDTDGTVIAVQDVGYGTAAHEPDLSGYTGDPIIGWNGDIDNVTESIEVTAIHGTVPASVTAAIASGKLPAHGWLVWGGGASGTWDASTRNWYVERDGVTRLATWKSGGTAVFAESAAVTVASGIGAGRLRFIGDASSVAFSGAALTLTDAVIDFGGNALARFNNELVATSGLIQMAMSGTTLAENDGVRFNANCAVSGGYLAISNGVLRVEGTGTVNSGVIDAATLRVHIAANSRLDYDSTAAQTFSTLVNGVNSGNAPGTLVRNSINGAILRIGPNAKNVTFSKSASFSVGATQEEGLNRVLIKTEIYGTAAIAEGTYQMFCNNPFGVEVEDGGVFNLNDGWNNYGHRWLILKCNAGGRVNCLSARATGYCDYEATFDGGVLDFATDYSNDLGKDNVRNSIRLKNGASITGKMMTWAFKDSTYMAEEHLYAEGTDASSIELEKIRLGRGGQTASSGFKMLEYIDVADATSNADVDLLVTSELYANPNAHATGDNLKYFGIVKSGAGTVKFTGESTNYNASVTLKAGTVAFGSSAKLNGTVLSLEDNASLAIDAGAEVSFADCSTTAWTAGKVLTIEGDLCGRSLRFGTDANGLTAEQLAAIVCHGKTNNVFLGPTGYLHAKDVPTVIVVR